MTKRRPGAAARTTIAVQGARVHNLKNISVEIPRDSLIVVTGLSGSGKSSLAFDTIYAEGQRRYMESLSSYAKRFVAQVTKPDVDFVFGLSPVISIEQKTLTSNPRSTVGTMTDIASYLNLLFATIGQAHCPRTGEPTPSRIGEPDPRSDPVAARGHRDRAARAGVQGLRRGARLRLHRAAQEGLPPADRRRQAGRHLRRARARRVRRSEHMDAVVDRFVVGRKHEKAIKAGDRQHAARRRRPAAGARRRRARARPSASGSTRAVQRDAPLRLRRHRPEYFVFNDPEERVPHLRRARRRQAHASRAARSRPAAQHPRRLLRARGVQVQPGHLGRPDDVQPRRRRCGFSLDTPWKRAARDGARGDALRHRAAEDRADVAARSQGERATIRRARRSASTASRGASSAATAATGSAAKRTRGWRRGSTR